MLDSGGNQSGSKDRVTLKKEIGLLSACAIIIGEMFPHINVNACSLTSLNFLTPHVSLSVIFSLPASLFSIHLDI